MFAKSAILAVAALSASAFAQNLVVNGGFDQESTPGVSPQGDQPPLGWSDSDTTGADLVDNYAYVSPGFGYAIGSTTPVTLAQTITEAVSGQCYVLSFYAGIEAPTTAAATGLSVTFGNLVDQAIPVSTYTPVNQGPNTGGWVQSTFNVLATADQTLSFTGFSDFYVALDDVSVVPTDLTACLGASARARTRRNKRHSHQAQW